MKKISPIQPKYWVLNLVTLFSSQVSISIGFLSLAMLPAHGTYRGNVFGGKQFHWQKSCENELANEWACCIEENASYKAI